MALVPRSAPRKLSSAAPGSTPTKLERTLPTPARSASTKLAGALSTMLANAAALPTVRVMVPMVPVTSP